MKASIHQKLDSLRERFEELEGLLAEADVIADQDQYRSLSQEYARLAPVVRLFASYSKLQANMAAAREMTADNDAEIRTLGPAWRAAGNRVLYIACVPHAADIYDQDELEASADVIVWLTKTGEPVPVHRSQDCTATGHFFEQLHHYARGQLSSNNSLAIPLSTVTQVLVNGDHQFVSMFMQAREGILREYLTHSPPVTIAVNGPMQCMLKGICAQCLQWQIDPTTKHRTKAIFACSWQNQPVEIVDLNHLAERSQQNRLPEQLNHLWLDYLLTYHAVERI